MLQTKGELIDYNCPHNARIEATLEAAKQELADCKGRCVWGSACHEGGGVGAGAVGKGVTGATVDVALQ